MKKLEYFLPKDFGLCYKIFIPNEKIALWISLAEIQQFSHVTTPSLAGLSKVRSPRRQWASLYGLSRGIRKAPIQIINHGMNNFSSVTQYMQEKGARK
jgi:hypothetical protein